MLITEPLSLQIPFICLSLSLLALADAHVSDCFWRKMLLFIWLTFFTSVITSVELRFHIADSAVNTQGHVSGPQWPAPGAVNWKGPVSLYHLETRTCRPPLGGDEDAGAPLDRHSSQGRLLKRIHTWIRTLLRDSQYFRSPEILQPPHPPCAVI